MTTRRRWHVSALAVAALIVAGCGGGGSSVDAPLASRVVVFGDSLSDVGTYLVATGIPLAALGVATGQAQGEAPYFGGKFTTNAHTGYACQKDPVTGVLLRNPANNQLICSNTSNANIWVEWIAARLGVVITQAEVGFGPTRIPCPAAGQGLAGSCSGYAQGGSRVTDPNGIGKASGALTIPMAAQIASHNTRVVPGFTSGFTSGDIVFVFGGNNDVFVQATAAGAGAITPTQAAAAVTQAGTELSTLVKNEILAKGATRVAVMTLPDSATTPFGASLSVAARGALTQLSAAFNAALLAGLDGSDAKIIDARALNAAVQASPSTFGITNITTPACNAQIIAGLTGGLITDGSSLFCNAAPAALFTAAPPIGAGLPISFNGLSPGASASGYLFADGVHPTTGGHKVFADQVWTVIKGFGWVPANL
jgi:outer membrane lipase/esterase